MSAPKLRVAATKRPTPAESSHPVDAPLTIVRHIVLPAYENITLVLQGDGAFNSYQADAFEGLDEVGVVPNWIADISTGALNIIVIASNAPKHRQAKPREFWQTTARPMFSPLLPDILENAWFDGNMHLHK